MAVLAVQFHGLPYFVGIAMPLILIVPLTQVLVVQRQPVVPPRITPFIVAFLAVNLISALFAVYLDSAWVEIRNMVVEGIALYFFVVNLVRTPEMLRKVIWTLVLVAAGIGALTLIQELTHTYSNWFGGFAQTTFEAGDAPGDRPIQQGPIGEQNRFAQVILYVLPLAVFLARDEPTRALRRLGAVCALLIGICVVLTFSRGGTVGLVAVLLGLLLMRAIRGRQILAVVLAVVITLVVIPGYRERVSTLFSVTEIFQPETSSHERADSSARAGHGESRGVPDLGDHPVLGVGPDQFGADDRSYAEKVSEYSNLFDVRQRFAEREAHILYLGVAAETGILGLLCRWASSSAPSTSFYEPVEALARAAACRHGVRPLSRSDLVHGHRAVPASVVRAVLLAPDRRCLRGQRRAVEDGVAPDVAVKPQRRRRTALMPRSLFRSDLR